MKFRNNLSIAVVGTINWVEVAANLLRCGGLQARSIRAGRRWLPFRMLFSWRFLSADVAHIVWGGDVAVSLVARHLLRKKMVWHWLGSDVVQYANERGFRQSLRRYLAAHHVAAHLADSPELAEELKSLGIEASVCRLLPNSIEANVMPLPDRFRVLSYWADNRKAFYGGDIILELASQMPDVEFLIAGAYGKDAPVLPNVNYLGKLSNLEEIYRKTSVFLRLPEHDSLSAMVLEALARGRYVIYNKDFPYCHRADTLEHVRAKLEEIRRLTEPNRAGSEFVRERFSLQREAESLERVYADCFGDGPSLLKR